MMTLEKSRVITAGFHSCTRLTSINLCKLVAAVSAAARSPTTPHRNTSTSWRRSRRHLAPPRRRSMTLARWALGGGYTPATLFYGC